MSRPEPATLETERLRLRPPVATDLAAHHAAIGSDPGVPWTGRARTLEESRETLDHRLRHWAEHGFGMWTVEWRDSGDYLGEAGLQHFDGTDQIEVGYYLGRAAWGRGVATEAGEAALAYGFETLGLERIVGVVRPGNDASKRVLGKLGLRFRLVEAHYGVPDAEVWWIDREEWQGGR